MQPVTLRNTPLVTSPIGFGCVNLTMHDDRRKAIEMLEAAFELGVTHFDVARLYGFGQAEGILGEFLQGKRDKVTVTTKFGLEASPALSKHRRLVSFVRKMSHRFRFVGRLARHVSGTGAKRSGFTCDEARRSLETSLRELKSDYVDLLELHEPIASETHNEELLDFLEAQVRAGRVRATGVGLAYDRLGGDAAAISPRLAVLQFDSDACNGQLQRLSNRASRGLITFGAIRKAGLLARAAGENAGLRDRWCARLGVNITDASTIAALMLRHAVFVNPRGIALFTTTREQNLRSNVRLFNEMTLTSRQLEDFAAFAREATSLDAA